MAALETGMLELPGTSLGIVRDAALDSGILGNLVAERPTLFGPVKGATFSGVPRAAVVGESEAKPGEEPFSLTPFSAQPIKLVTQVRTSDEFKWANEDYQLGILDDLVAPAIGASIGRAVDLLAFHGINPKTGLVATAMPKYLSQATKVVEIGTAPTAELNEAVGLVASTGVAMPNGIAMDAAYNYALATEVYPAGHSLAGQPVYPTMAFNGIDAWRGLTLAKSSTVSGRPEIADTTIRAFVGDFSEVKWGFQRNFPIQMLEYGDPDNTGRDLAGHNEILLRAEAVVYIAIGDLAKFAVAKEAA